MLSMRTFWTLLVTAGLAALALQPDVARAQEATTMEETVRVVPQADGPVYVFHTKRLSSGAGFTVHREHEGTEETLTDQPVRGAQSATALEEALSPARMEDLQTRLDVASPLEVYYDLRSDRTAALRFAFTDSTLARVLGFLYVDDEAPNQGQVTYRVAFVDVNGTPTGEDLTETVELPGQRPARPTDLSAEHDPEELTLSWSYPTSTISIPDNVVSFRAYRRGPSGRERLAPGEIWLRRVSQTRQEIRVPAPETGTTHTFVVRAVDITGQESPPSEPLEYTVEDQTPPDPPQDVRSRVAGDEQATVTWATPPQPDVAGYRVYRAPRMVEEGEPLTDQLLPLNQTSFVDSTVSGGGKFVYRVTAVDSASNESATSQGTQAFVNDRIPPSAPSAISAQFDSTSGHVQLAWQHVPEAEDFSDYALMRTRTDDASLFTRLDSSDIVSQSFVDQGVARRGFAEGARYRYGVAAIDSAGNLSDTAFVPVKIPNLSAPERPTRLSARSPDGLDVDLRWTPPPDADVTAYRVYRTRDDTAGAAGELPNRPLAERPDPTTFFEDTTAAVAQPYTYRVTAVDSLGKEGPPSEPVAFTLRDDAPPRPVRNVQAIRTDTTETEGIRITWGPVAATDLDTYRIERASIPTGTYEPIHTAGPETTAWTDPDGQVGAWYRVRAVDTSGNDSRPSEPAQAVRTPTAASP